ncbi:MAG: phosphopantetheine-binding protein, partial [Desulfobacterales bacterium]
SVRKEIRPREIPFDRERALSLDTYLRYQEMEDSLPVDTELDKKDKVIENSVAREDIDNLVSDLFFQLTNIKEIDPDIELTNQGLSSLSGTELITQLEASLNIEIGPEILFEYPLRDQFVDQICALVAGAAGIEINAAAKGESYEIN